jgi:hypothetical protein
VLADGALHGDANAAPDVGGGLFLGVGVSQLRPNSRRG